MDYAALFKAIGVCLISVIFEALGTSKEGKIWFENLKKPKYSFPFWMWYIVGFLFYIICGLIAYRIFIYSNSNEYLLSLLLLMVMMFGNGLTNFILFRIRSLNLYYFSIFPFCIILILLYLQLRRFDIISSWILLPYLIWGIYDIYLLHSLWKLNK